MSKSQQDAAMSAMEFAAKNPEATQAALNTANQTSAAVADAGGGSLSAGAKLLGGAAAVGGVAAMAVTGSVAMGVVAAGGAAYAATTAFSPTAMTR